MFGALVADQIQVGGRLEGTPVAGVRLAVRVLADLVMEELFGAGRRVLTSLARPNAQAVVPVLAQFVLIVDVVGVVIALHWQEILHSDHRISVTDRTRC